MNNISAISYMMGAALFLALSVLLLTSWRGRLPGALLVVATITTFLWCSVLAYEAVTSSLISFRILFVLEVLKDAAWLSFVVELLGVRKQDAVALRLRYSIHALWVVALSLGLLPDSGIIARLPGGLLTLRAFGLVLLSVAGLMLIEQWYRNASPDQRWEIKYLCFGVGGLFLYDLVLYTDTLMYQQINSELWGARGAVNALAVPLIAVSSARNPQWSPDLFVSRRLVFYGAVLVGVGVFFVITALGGYYVRVYGGDWGAVAQMSFVFGALFLLLTMLFSGQVRAHLKVFLSKHFYKYKYDYRDEWLRFIGTLAGSPKGFDMRMQVIEAMGQIVDATGGMLWMRGKDGDFECVSHRNMTPPIETIGPNDGLVTFLEDCNWVVDLEEYAAEPRRYQGLDLPAWVRRCDGGWLVIPLRHQRTMTGFVVLGRALAPRDINWEDRDLLKTAGQQAAGYLALSEASEELSHARQFEAFNRLSAYVVHDLKNMVAQLSLLVSNFERHKHKPKFVDDAIGTVDNAVRRMNQLLAHLRTARFKAPASAPVVLNQCIEEVASRCSSRSPIPALKTPVDGALTVLADHERLVAVFEHLVQNGQEATGDDGSVSVVLDRCGDLARVRISDDGTGMDAKFIRTRLYRPFDTTKGNAGMGIGVYEAREFVLSMGGKMQVESAVGNGTTFTILLPLALPDAAAKQSSGMAG